MNKRILELATVCILSFTAATIQAQTPIIINNPDIDSWGIIGEQSNVRVSDAKVAGGTALEVTVPKKGDNTWDVQALTDVFQPIHKGDHIHVAIPLKGKVLDGTGNVKLYMALQSTGEDHHPFGRKSFTISPEWQTYGLDAFADADYAAGTVGLTVHLATGKQVVDLGPATITDAAPSTVAATASAAPATNVLNNPILDAWYISGEQTNAHISDAKVPGGEAIEVTLAKKAPNPWDALAQTAILQEIHKGHHIHIAIPIKGKMLEGTGNVKLYMAFQVNTSPYHPIGRKNFTISPEWQTYGLDVFADDDYPAKATALVIHLASDKQVVDLGPATITDATIPAGPAQP
jgi:hypothetical protein